MGDDEDCEKICGKNTQDVGVCGMVLMMMMMLGGTGGGWCCVLDKVGIALVAFSSPSLPTVVHCRCCVADIEEGFGRRLRTTSPVQQQAMTVVSAMMVWGSEASTASQWLTWVL